LYIYSS